MTNSLINCGGNSRSHGGKVEPLKGRAGMRVESGQSHVKLRRVGKVTVIRPRILCDEDQTKRKDGTRAGSHES